MTTVAYRAGIMACDSCWTYGGDVDTLGTKIARLKSGALLGQAGDNDARHVIAMLASVKTEKQLPSYPELDAIRLDFMGLLVLPNKRMFKIATELKEPAHRDPEEDGPGVWEVEGDFTAIGSGMAYAIGAMEAGANARQAVRIACRRDTNSRPPVHTLSFPEKK